MLDNNVQKQQQAQMQFQSLTPQQQEQLRQQITMQAGVNPELLKEIVQDTYVANRVSNTTDDPKGMLWTAGLTLPAWYAIAKGMDKYAEHCRGDYKKLFRVKLKHGVTELPTDAVKTALCSQSARGLGRLEILYVQKLSINQEF